MSDASSTATAQPAPWACNVHHDESPTPSHPSPEYPSKSEPGVAGNAFVYLTLDGNTSPFPNHIIRERVSTNGILRPLEPESELPGCTLPIEKLGVVSETAAKRYLEGQALWDKKYKGAAKKAEKNREKHLARAIVQSGKVLDKIQGKMHNVRTKGAGSAASQDVTDREADEAIAGGALNEVTSEEDIHVMLNAPTWTWSWALDDENPPPSSIVARGDTASRIS